MLEQLQGAITQGTGQPWPLTAENGPAQPYALVLPDRYNSRLQLGYGDPDAPLLRVVEHDFLIHMYVHSV